MTIDTLLGIFILKYAITQHKSINPKTMFQIKIILLIYTSVSHFLKALTYDLDIK